jgi:hypothetical protein
MGQWLLIIVLLLLILLMMLLAVIVKRLLFNAVLSTAEVIQRGIRREED